MWFEVGIRGYFSYCWVQRTVCGVVLEIKLPALLRVRDYSHANVVPAITDVGAIWGPPQYGDPHPHIASIWGMGVPIFPH